MDVLISADMEGAAGIATRRQAMPGAHDCPIARVLMTAAANAAIAGAFDGGATSIVVNDSHGPVDNLLGGQLGPRRRRACRPRAGQRAGRPQGGAPPHGEPPGDDGRARRLVHL
jgi:hypothetical protein